VMHWTARPRSNVESIALGATPRDLVRDHEGAR